MTQQTVLKERRDSARIQLKAFAYNHRGEISSNGAKLPVSLIDIAPGGARVKLLNGSHHVHPPAVGDVFLFNIRIELLDVETGAVPCQAAWVDGDEMGVVFGQDLPCTASDLQTALG
jgi:hypothetical protein